MYKKQHFNILINLILRAFNLQWNERLGLTYDYNLHHGNIMFKLTDNIEDVLEFLGLDPNKYINDTYTMNNFLELLSECKYINLPSFFSDSVELSSPNLEEFRRELIDSIKFTLENQHIPYIEKIENNFIPYKDKNRFIHMLDKSFNKKNSLIRAISKLNKMANKEQKSFIKNRFNGKLAVSWIPELKKEPNLGEYINAFKGYVERETNNVFNLYIKETSGKNIRQDFIDWYEMEIKQLDNEFNKIPI